MADLERVFMFAFKGTNPFPGYLKPEPHLVNGPFFLGETKITPLPVPHGTAEVNGYMFSRIDRKVIAYLSDCSAVPDEIAEKILGVECLIIDALRVK
jgi:phosphoribosyl 1,2-cyclic phosphate phosphodiesterase